MLAQLCEGEAFDLVQNTQDSNGWEAWRVISKRFDPHGAGRKRSVMSQLLAPGSFDLKNLNSAIARWEEMLRVYERRAGKDLPDDVKATIHTEMTKGALEDRLLLNASRFKTYVSVRDEIQCYLESKRNQEAVPMDIGALNKNGGKGKGKGEGTGAKGKGPQVCNNCSKQGHWWKDCAAPGGGAAIV